MLLVTGAFRTLGQLHTPGYTLLLVVGQQYLAARMHDAHLPEGAANDLIQLNAATATEAVVEAASCAWPCRRSPGFKGGGCRFGGGGCPSS